MRNQLLSFVVADLILQSTKLRQSACVTLQAVADGTKDGFFFAVKYLRCFHKNSAPTIMLDVWAMILSPREFRYVVKHPLKMP